MKAKLLLAAALLTLSLVPAASAHQAMGASQVVGIALEGDAVTQHHCDQVLYLPRVNRWVAPVLAVLPTQMLAYYAATARGADVDKPRNLAKSVTVE